MVVGAGQAMAQSGDLASATVIISEANGFPGVCAAPCFEVEKQADVYSPGAPGNPGVCGAGENTFIYTITNLAGAPATLPSPGIPITEFEVGVDFSLVTSAGAIPGVGIAPTGTVVSPLNVVNWTFPLSTACPGCLDQGKTSDQLFICAAPGTGFASSADNVSTTAIILDASGECPVPVEAAADTCLLLIDEDSIDNGNPPNFFTNGQVNDDIVKLAQRQELRFFDANEGQTITLHTGEVGDEGWFAPKFFPSSWAAAGPTNDSARNFVGNPGLGPNMLPYNVGPGLGTLPNPEGLLDKIPQVTPLRATGLEQLIGQTCCAVVWDSDISIGYDPLNGSMKGVKLGTVAFEVLDVRQLFGFSSSSLPEVDIAIRDAETVCELNLTLNTEAPEPLSSKLPFDIAPGRSVRTSPSRNPTTAISL